MKPQTKKDRSRYYSYVLCYVDDVLCIHETPNLIIELLRKTYKLEESSVGTPTMYLGAEVKKYYIPDSELKSRNTISQIRIVNS
jgi:hypothetical protein